MSHDQFQNEHDDLKQLFQRTRPRETAVDIDEIVTLRPARSVQTDEAGPSRRWNVAVTSATLAVVLAGLLLFIPNRTTESLAFAQVKEQVERIRTVDYVQTSLIVDDLPEGAISTTFGEKTPLSVLKQLVESLESRLKSADPEDRSEINFRLALLKPYIDPPITQVPDGIQRIRIKGKQLQRTDKIFPVGQLHYVRNARTGETVSFDHEQKTKSRLTKQVVIDRKTGKRTEHPIKIPRTVDFFHRFRSIPEDATQRLPGKEIDGRKVIGFRSVENHETGKWTRTFWIDEETKLPVQIVTDFESQQKGLSSSKWIQDRFVFDKELDDALFSTKTPEGYSEKEKKVHAYK